MKAHYQAVDGKVKTVACDFIKEGDHGVFLYEEPDDELIGYIPFDRFFYLR